MTTDPSVIRDNPESTTTTIPGGESTNYLNVSDISDQKDVVSYETHRKLLGEKKKIQERLAELEKAELTRKEQSLKEQERYKELLDLKEKALLETQSRLELMESQRAEARKLDAFLKCVNGQINEKYWGLVPLDKIIVDKETGEIDKTSVTQLVQEYQNNFPETIISKDRPGLPNNFVKGSNTELSYDDWLKLPPKEMVERRKDVVEPKGI